MNRIRSLLIRALNVFRRSRLENDLSEQMTAHRDMIEADLIRRGVSAEEAARAARRAVGNDLLLRELSLDEMGYRLVDELRRDIRYAVRGLVWNPQLTTVAVLSFALGIGANVAIFSSVDQMLFRPLPYEDPDSLFVVREHTVDDNQGYGTLPARYVVEMRRNPQGVLDLGVVTGGILYDSTSDPNGEPALSLVGVSFNTLKVLGVEPMMGRDFTEAEARQKRPLCLVTYEAWKAKLNSDPAVIGRALWREQQRCEVVGVLPPGFLAPPSPFGSRRADGLILSSNLLDSAEARDRSGPPYVRLKPGVSIAAAEAELNAIANRVKAELPRSPGAPDTTLRLEPIRQAMFGPHLNYSWLVTGAAGLVLLLTCANIASLLLVRARSQEHIAAVRVALGASPARLIRTALAESLTLAAVGSLVALLFLAWSGDALRLLLPPVFSEFAASFFDSRVLAFCLFAACGSAVVSIVLPSFRLGRIDVVSALQGTGGSSGRRRLVGGRTLLVIEAAVGVVLVAGTAATSRSLVGLLRTDLGFDTAQLYQIRVLFPEAPDSESRFLRYYRSLDVLRGLPGVRSAAGANVLPTIIGAAGWRVFGEGYEGYRWHVSNDYFETLRQPVLAGRAIAGADVTGRARVAVLGVSGLRQVWPDTPPADAVGRVLRFPGEEPIEVIGVVSDFRSAYAETPLPALYMPITPDMMRYMMYAVRMESGRVPSVREVRERLGQEIGQPSSVNVSAVTEGIDETLRRPKFQVALFGLFGLIALASAAVGLYGVCSFEVALRRREMGIRLALGGSQRDLQRHVIAHAIRPALIGVAAGLLVAYWAAKFLQAFLHQVDARDPWTLALVAAVLILTASIAAWLPARRASRLNPADILRAM